METLLIKNKNNRYNENILFIKDVKIEDLIEWDNSSDIITMNNNNEFVDIDTLHRGSFSSTENNVEHVSTVLDYQLEQEKYDLLKEKFNGLQEWDRNNILCWYCCCNFITKPIFIPKNIKNESSMDVFGNFCSFPCAYKYILIHYSNKSNLKSNFINNLKFLYKIFTNNTIIQIEEPPERELLKKFGGTMTEIEYKNKLKKTLY